MLIFDFQVMIVLTPGEGMTVGLSELPSLAEKMLSGHIRGRYVVDPGV